MGLSLIFVNRNEVFIAAEDKRIYTFSGEYKNVVVTFSSKSEVSNDELIFKNLNDFENKILKSTSGMSVEDISKKMSTGLMGRLNIQEIEFAVVGYDKDSEKPSLYNFMLPRNLSIHEYEINPKFNIFSYGNDEIIHKILIGYDKKYLDVLEHFISDKELFDKILKSLNKNRLNAKENMSYDECIDYIKYLIGASVDLQQFILVPRKHYNTLDIYHMKKGTEAAFIS